MRRLKSYGMELTLSDAQEILSVDRLTERYDVLGVIRVKERKNSVVTWEGHMYVGTFLSSDGTKTVCWPIRGRNASVNVEAKSVVGSNSRDGEVKTALEEVMEEAKKHKAPSVVVLLGEVTGDGNNAVIDLHSAVLAKDGRVTVCSIREDFWKRLVEHTEEEMEETGVHL